MRVKRIIWDYDEANGIWQGEIENPLTPHNFTLTRLMNEMYLIESNIESIPSTQCVGLEQAKKQAQWLFECYVKDFLSN